MEDKEIDKRILDAEEWLGQGYNSLEAAKRFIADACNAYRELLNK